MTNRNPEVAVVVTEPGQNVALLAKEILKTLDWPNALVTDDTEEAVSLVNTDKAHLVVIDDTPERPAPILIRRLVRNPLVPITPMLLLLSEHNKQESQAISTLGRPMIVHKPLTPGRFAPGFKTLLNVWSKGIFAEIKKANKLIATGSKEAGMEILTELTRNQKAQPVIAPTIAMLLRMSNNVKVAEKILLSALKRAPRDLGLILALSDLYMHAAMPFTALRLMKGVDAAYGETMTSYMDKLQAHLMLNDLDSICDVLQEMSTKQLFASETKDHLLRVLFSQGKVDDFLMLIKSDARAHHFSNAWGKGKSAESLVEAS